MIQGKRSSRPNEGLVKSPEKNSISKVCEKNKKLPEKTKFTLQYQPTNNPKSIRTEEKITRSVLVAEARVPTNTRLRLQCTGEQDGQSRWRKEHNATGRCPKSGNSRMTDDRKVRTAGSSGTFVGATSTMDKSLSVTNNKSLPAEKTRSRAVTRISHESGSNLSTTGTTGKRKNETELCSPNAPPTKSKTEMKVNFGKTTILQKSTISSPGLKLKVNDKCVKNIVGGGISRPRSSEKNREKIEPHDGIGAEETRPPSREMKRTRSEEEPAKPIEESCVGVRMRSKSRESAPLSRGNDAVAEKDEQLARKELAVTEREEGCNPRGRSVEGEDSPPLGSEGKGKKDDLIEVPGRTVQDACKGAPNWTNRHIMHVHNAAVVVTGEEPVDSEEKTNDSVEAKEEFKGEQVCEQPADEVNFSSAPSFDNYDSFDSLDEKNTNEDFLQLDKTRWSVLEIQIKETCEETEFLSEITKESEESFSEIFDTLNMEFIHEESPLQIGAYAPRPSIAADRNASRNADAEKRASEGQTERQGGSPLYWWKEKGAEDETKSDLARGAREMPTIRERSWAPFVMDPRGRFSRNPPKAEKEPRPSKAKKSGTAAAETRRARSEGGGHKSEASGAAEVVEREGTASSLAEHPPASPVFEDRENAGGRDGKNASEGRPFSEGGKTRSAERVETRARGKALADRPAVSGFFRTHENVAFIGQNVDEQCVSFEIGQVTLYQPDERQMLFHDIANCAATQAYLKMCGINFELEIRKNAEHMSPSGKVPFISSGLCVIPEFEAIVSFMQFKKFACIRVEERDQPTFRALIAMIANTLEAAERYICWYDEGTAVNYTKPRIAGQYPFPLNHIIHWRKRTLSQHLGDNSFFFGNICTEIDALMYGHIYALFTTELDGPFKDIQFIVQQFPNLVTFAINFDKMFSLHKFSTLDLSYWDNLQSDSKGVGKTSVSVNV